MARQLNVYVDKPTYYEKDVGKLHYDKYFVINLAGRISSHIWEDEEFNDTIYRNTILFKDCESAENFKEFMSDVMQLQRPFEIGGTNCYFLYDHARGLVDIDFTSRKQRRDHYFDYFGAKWLLSKYGNEFIKNWLLYCK